MSTLPAVEHLILDQDTDWLTIWFNRPESRNALAHEMTAELRLGKMNYDNACAECHGDTHPVSKQEWRNTGLWRRRRVGNNLVYKRYKKEQEKCDGRITQHD